MPGSAAWWPASFDGLLREQRFKRVDFVPARECKEALVRGGAMAEIGLEHALDGLRRILRLDVAVNLAAAHGIRPEAAADSDVVTLDLVAVLGDLHLGAKEPDVADVMLPAGIGA